MRIWLGLILFLLWSSSCAKERPYLSGHVKRASDAIMVPCDPYGLGNNHQCVVFAASFREHLYAYNATAGEMVLAPMGYFPLKIRVGTATDLLVPVTSADPRVPFMFALDHGDGKLYPIRLFPADNEASFSTSKPVQLTKTPLNMAALDVADKIITFGTHPDDGAIEILAFDKKTGQRESKHAPITIKVGTRPHHVQIDSDRKVAVFSDEKSNALHVLDLSNIDDVVTKAALHKIKSITLARPIDRLYLSTRDFGTGAHLYAMVLSTTGNDVALVDIDGAKLEAELKLDEFPMAGYFPDEKCSTCCSGKKNWFSVVTVKGNLNYIVISQNGLGFSLEKSTVVELTSENNLSLSKLHVRKIIGGHIPRDTSIDREVLCSSDRQVFYISSFGASRSYLNIEPVEVEAHGYSCEGEASASRFGYKH